MKQLVLIALSAGLFVALRAAASAGPVPAPAAAPIAAPRDIEYPGAIALSVDASDIERHIVHVHESITGLKGAAVLLYPEWLPGDHSPDGHIDRFAGLKISTNGTNLAWTRDTVNMFAFHVDLTGTGAVNVDFDYLSPTSGGVGGAESTGEILILEWNSLIVYPAGYFTRRIPYRPNSASRQNGNGERRSRKALPRAMSSASRGPPSRPWSTAPFMRGAMRAASISTPAAPCP